jgi:hypothetical protein
MKTMALIILRMISKVDVGFPLPLPLPLLLNENAKDNK